MSHETTTLRPIGQVRSSQSERLMYPALPPLYSEHRMSDMFGNVLHAVVRHRKRIAAAITVITLGAGLVGCTDSDTDSHPPKSPSTTTYQLQPGEQWGPTEEQRDFTYELTANAAFGDGEVSCYETRHLSDITPGSSATSLAEDMLREYGVQMLPPISTNPDAATAQTSIDGEPSSVYVPLSLSNTEVEQLATLLAPGVLTLNGQSQPIAGGEYDIFGTCYYDQTQISTGP